jgi:hypothetical protein
VPGPHDSIAPRDEDERFLVALLDALWERYRARMEPVRRYEALAARRGWTLRNDHVAFRAIAWQSPAAGAFCVSRLFERLGYAAAGCYVFSDKHLSSVHYQHPNAAMPKLFISQLEAWKLSCGAREILGRSLSRHRAPLSDADLASPELSRWLRFFGERPWPAPRREDVLALDRESQFGAWVLLHGYDVNHFTGRVDDIEAAVAAMREDGSAMKAEIEGARGAVLRQSSTRAVTLAAEVENGSLDWPYAYFELAQRSAGFEGFLGPQAANLFEITKKAA